MKKERWVGLKTILKLSSYKNSTFGEYKLEEVKC